MGSTKWLVNKLLKLRLRTFHFILVFPIVLVVGLNGHNSSHNQNIIINSPSTGTDKKSIAPVLRAAAVPLLDQSTCKSSEVNGGRNQQILDSMLCAG